MADDKVRYMAADIGYAVAEALGYVQAGGVQGLQAMLRDNGIAKIAERILRAELKPLLDAAQAVVAFHTHKNLSDCLSCRLAAELKGWRK